jgi:hypothetical protein
MPGDHNEVKDDLVVFSKKMFVFVQEKVVVGASGWDVLFYES